MSPERSAFSIVPIWLSQRLAGADATAGGRV